MKNIFLFFVLPFFIAASVVLFISHNVSVNSFLANQTEESDSEADMHFPRCISAINSNPFLESLILSDTKTIYIFGSSELSTSTPAIPYNFFPDKLHASALAVGHAGNQCFSIYTQLLANRNSLKDKKIVVMVSPGWFESKPSKGTSSAVFLEFNSEKYVTTILSQEKDDFSEYAQKRIADFYNEFNSPYPALKLMAFNHQASKSFLHKCFYQPLIAANMFVMNNNASYGSDCYSVSCGNIEEKASSINWDSLLAETKTQVLSRASNNPMGIENNYYNQYINGSKGNVSFVNEKFNQELEDFKMLVRLLKTENADACFVISPLNPYYYEDIAELKPTIFEIKNIIGAHYNLEQNCFNLFSDSKETYDKALLNDVMHFSDYGWYCIDKYIASKYQLINKDEKH
jgi:D-alanyl-lipoteichoic acid biosynthesis protein DltD